MPPTPSLRQVAAARGKLVGAEPAPGQFTFERGDRLIRFAREHGMKVKGHTPVWHQALPSWVGRLGDAVMRAFSP